MSVSLRSVFHRYYGVYFTTPTLASVVGGCNKSPLSGICIQPSGVDLLARFSQLRVLKSTWFSIFFFRKNCLIIILKCSPLWWSIYYFRFYPRFHPDLNLETLWLCTSKQRRRRRWSRRVFVIVSIMFGYERKHVLQGVGKLNDGTQVSKNKYKTVFPHYEIYAFLSETRLYLYQSKMKVLRRKSVFSLGTDEIS